MDVTAAPDTDELQLEWVHGYRGFDCRNNVFYASAKGSSGSNERQRYVLYHAAALGILLDPVNRTQRYFRGHTDDILAMAVCSTYNDGSSTIVATGQQAKASTFVWEVPSLKTLAVLQTNQKSVACICFSNDGRLVVTIAQDKTVAVCDWQSQTLLCNTKGVASVTHHLVCSSVRATATNFISCGDKHIRYWTLNGRNLTAAKVLTSSCKGAVIQEYLCITECEGKFLVGCEDGMLYTVSTDGKGVKGKFSHHLLKKEEELKKLGKRGASVTAITYCKQKVLLVTGAKDGSVVVWHPEALASGDTLAAKDIFCSFNIQNVGVPDIMAKQLQGLSIYDSEIPGIASNSILVLASTRGCDLLEIKCTKLGSAELYNQNSLCPDGKSVYGVPAFSALSCGILNRSHCNNELWGVSCHPTRPEYCSVGDDKTLRFYHLHTKCMLASVSLGSIARTCAYSPDGMLVAIGFGGSVGRGKEAGGGIVRIYSAYQSDLGEAVGANSVRKLAERADAKQWISDVKFSSDSSTLVVGAHDCKIYIYDVTVKEKSYTLKPRTIFTKHNSVINHIDLSADGRFMQSNCSAYELLFADTTNGKHITHASELKDVAWHSWTCTLGWPVQGIWASGMNGSDINAVDRSHSVSTPAYIDRYLFVRKFYS